MFQLDGVGYIPNSDLQKGVLVHVDGPGTFCGKLYLTGHPDTIRELKENLAVQRDAELEGMTLDEHRKTARDDKVIDAFRTFGL